MDYGQRQHMARCRLRKSTKRQHHSIGYGAEQYRVEVDVIIYRNHVDKAIPEIAETVHS